MIDLTTLINGIQLYNWLLMAAVLMGAIALFFILAERRR